MAPRENGISQKRHLKSGNPANTKIRHKLEKLDFKIPWARVWIIQKIEEFPFKIHSAQPLGIFYNVYHSYKAPFFRVSYLFILGGVFAMCHFCKVSLFLNYIKGYIFYAGCIWWRCFCFVIASYVHKTNSLRL